MLEFLKKEAVKMGKIALKHFRNLKEHHIENKSDEVNDPVTIADLEVSKYIHSRIKDRFGDSVNVLSEEAIKKFKKDDRPLIVIDEIDGTYNFSTGKSTFCIMLAYADSDSEIKASVVYKPYDNILYYASRGEGAFIVKDGKTERIHVSDRKKFVMNETVSYFSAFYKILTKDMISKYDEIIKIVHGLRLENPMQKTPLVKGSTGLQAMEISKGNQDIYFVVKCGNWDYAAPSLILEEAGGKIYHCENKEDILNPRVWKLELDNAGDYRPCILTNGVIDENFFSYLRERI